MVSFSQFSSDIKFEVLLLRKLRVNSSWSATDSAGSNPGQTNELMQVLIEVNYSFTLFEQCFVVTLFRIFHVLRNIGTIMISRSPFNLD